MSQDQVDGKHEGQNRWQWIQVKKRIGPSDWTYKEILESNRKKCGFQIKIVFEPKLSKVNSIFQFGHKFYHKTITLDVFIALPNIKTDTDLRICYIPMSTNEKDAFLENSKMDIRGQQSSTSYSKNFKSYVWLFDICLVKLVFRNDTDNTKSITKNFHLEHETGNIKRDGHSFLCPDGLVYITNSDVISMADLENILGSQHVQGKDSFISLDIEFRARLQLRPVLPDFRILSPDDQCSLEISGMELIQSEDMAVSSLNLVSPNNESKLIFSDLASDITFELASAPSKMMPAHSWVLAAQSPVFRRMLSADMLEKKTGVIKLEHDTTLDSLEIFLTYLYRKMGFLSYSEDVDLSSKYKTIDEWTVELSLNILYLAHFYQVSNLTELCIENIISRPDSEISTQLAVHIFKAGILYDDDDLGTRFVDWVKRQPKVKVVKTELMKLLKEESQAALWNLVRLLII